jgi:hypothetical protein
MSKKRVLIVSRSFYPMNSPRSFRTTELAKEFARQGHSVTVITPENEIHSSFANKHNIVIKDLGKPKWNAIQLKGQGLSLKLRRLFRRTSNLFLQYPEIELQWMVERALEKESGYDLLISVAVPYPVHWGVARARTQSHQIAKIWVADCGDPFMGQENDTFTPPFYFKYVEKWFCRKADFLTVPTIGAKRGYYPEFHEKIKVIPQGFRFEDFQNTDNIGSHNIPTFAYAGGFIPGRRDPKEFLEYLVSLELDFEFHVYTNVPALVLPYLQKAKGRIILHEYIPRQDLLSHLCQMNFVVNFENIGDKQTPSKLIDYAIIGKPILSIKTGALDTAIVNEFLAGNYRNQLFIENPDQYRIENVCGKFLELTHTEVII